MAKTMLASNKEKENKIYTNSLVFRSLKNTNTELDFIENKVIKRTASINLSRPGNMQPI